jgi:hypothetical protein
VVGYLALIVEAQERHSRKHQILASLGQLAHQSTAARSPETIGWPNQHSMFSSIMKFSPRLLRRTPRVGSKTAWAFCPGSWHAC